MAIMRTARILPTPRRIYSVPYCVAPGNKMMLPVLKTAAQINAIIVNGASYAKGYMMLPVSRRAEYATPDFPRLRCMTFFGQPVPKVVRTEVPRKERFRRYYLYHMAAIRVGVAIVRTENTVKVVYLEPSQASHYLGCYVIGTLPWTALTAGMKAHINAFHHQVVE